jgi:hypothetical protein
MRGPRTSVAGGSDANMGRNGPEASDGRMAAESWPARLRRG